MNDKAKHSNISEDIKAVREIIKVTDETGDKPMIIESLVRVLDGFSALEASTAQLARENEAMLVKLAEAEKALEFYARESRIPQSYGMIHPLMEKLITAQLELSADNGEKARKTLAKLRLSTNAERGEK